MSGPAHWYRAYGLRIHSAVALPFGPLPEPSASAPFPGRSPADPQPAPPSPSTGRPAPAPSSCTSRASPGIWSPAAGTCSSSRSAQTPAASPGTPFTALLQQRGVATLHAPAGAQGVAEGTLEPPAIPAKLEYAH